MRSTRGAAALDAADPSDAADVAAQAAEYSDARHAMLQHALDTAEALAAQGGF